MHSSLSPRFVARFAAGLLAGWTLLAGVPRAAAAPAAAPPRRALPDLLVVTVDTLRQDRLGAYGYGRPTSPAIDRLLASGARFSQSYTPEPLTAPALTSLWTGIAPHQHGATRNGLRMKPGLLSLPKLLTQGGYRAAAFVGTWTLRDKLTGLAEHFGHYEEILNRRRWLGLFKGEATAEDLTDAALAWMREQRAREPRRPVLVWVHYVEPHAPYRLQEDFAARLRIPAGEAASRSDRYDSEIAFVDRAIERLLAGWVAADSRHDTLTIFAADHGESLGEHGDWGHGRNLYEPTLAIPMGLAWPGRVGSGRVITAPALLTDLPATVLGLLGLHPPPSFVGFDWSGVLLSGESPPAGRALTFQAHRGAVLGRDEGARVREKGLLEVGRLVAGRKEILHLAGNLGRLFDLRSDGGELRSLVEPAAPVSPELAAWLAEVVAGLRSLGDVPDTLDAESAAQLEALGYVE